jgi:dolichyl-phosphate-mannose--protein O-mannosyl transferase
LQWQAAVVADITRAAAVVQEVFYQDHFSPLLAQLIQLP